MTYQHSAFPRGRPSSARACWSLGWTWTDSQSVGSRNFARIGKSSVRAKPVTRPERHASSKVPPCPGPAVMRPDSPGSPLIAQHSPTVPRGTRSPNHFRRVVPPQTRSLNTGATTIGSTLMLDLPPT